ncbi:zinc ABC transporter substrate-binding protein [Marinomonas algarum]|uniref:High-affinity zinc uptake system protein ZnuA n=1 Tax=Marinomonas algarum TaxID=2883105 RepID=A0A9X1LBJ9_9GAMM|nr:zinc ABC transporter substrate-binding protein [Marinomonas algarum]MCB5160934.1 zinc ABC transporter substrate-binding protein [Marinomonas algarum]
MNKLVFALGVTALSPLALAKPVIATSIKPVSMIVSAIAGDRAEIQQIVSSTASPHDFALRPSDIKKIHNADTVVWVGESLEHFLEKPLENAGKEDSSIEWMALNGVILQDRSKKKNYDDHDEHDDHGHEGHDHDTHDHAEHDDHGHEGHDHDEHDHEEHDDHDHEGHDHDAHDHEEHDDHGHEGHSHTGIDPHLWLLPDNALVLARAVTQKMMWLDADHAAYYQGNFVKFEKGLHAKDAEIRQALHEVSDVPYVVFHDAYRYFEGHYGLHNAGAVTVSPERKPGAKKVAEIRRDIEANKVQCVFSEPQFSPAIVETLLDGTEVKSSVLDPIGSQIKIDENAYFAFLDSLKGQFLSCLK